MWTSDTIGSLDILDYLEDDNLTGILIIFWKE